mmetsp:Transcript_12841/g.28509  ORF Transcript_12841/g.28509 Transcript_12841/m.28509 type:complete len:228 (-) Transcript_12841:800-1483(-)
MHPRSRSTAVPATGPAVPRRVQQADQDPTGGRGSGAGDHLADQPQRRAGRFAGAVRGGRGGAGVADARPVSQGHLEFLGLCSRAARLLPARGGSPSGSVHERAQEGGQRGRLPGHDARLQRDRQPGHRAHDGQDRAVHFQPRRGAGDNARFGGSDVRAVGAVPCPGDGGAASDQGTQIQGHCHASPVRRHHRQYVQAGGRPLGRRALPAHPQAGPGLRRGCHERPRG